MTNYRDCFEGLILKIFENYKLILEGVEGVVSCKGPLINVLNQLIGGLKAVMGHTGNKDDAIIIGGYKSVKTFNAGLLDKSCSWTLII